MFLYLPPDLFPLKRFLKFLSGTFIYILSIHRTIFLQFQKISNIVRDDGDKVYLEYLSCMIGIEYREQNDFPHIL